jgi:fatty acid desaturase
VVKKYLVTSNEDDSDAERNPDWFRAPTMRERRIAAALFAGFGLFFIALFFVLSGWWFRWVILVLAGYSILAGVRHLFGIPTANIDRDATHDKDPQ